MNEIEFDRALSDFLDQEGSELAGEALFQLVRAAFTAGWQAAMGSDLGKVMNFGNRSGQGG